MLDVLQTLPWVMAGQIMLAALLGGMIGAEREWRGHAAGLRTNSLVAMGSCLFTILSIVAFPLQGSSQDTARIAAQIVTGIGFLGAGVVLHSGNRVRGLTTAATIWQVAAIGMAVGTSFYFLAVFTTVFTVAVLVLLQPVSRWLEHRRRRRRQRSIEDD